MFLNKKKATAEMTTALLCRANVRKDTFRTVAEYLEDGELKSILHVCAEILNARGASQSEMLAEMIEKAVSNSDSFDGIAEHIDSDKLQNILCSCGSVMVRRKHKKRTSFNTATKAVQEISAIFIAEGK